MQFFKKPATLRYLVRGSSCVEEAIGAEEIGWHSVTAIQAVALLTWSRFPYDIVAPVFHLSANVVLVLRPVSLPSTESLASKGPTHHLLINPTVPMRPAPPLPPLRLNLLPPTLPSFRTPTDPLITYEHRLGVRNISLNSLRIHKVRPIHPAVPMPHMSVAVQPRHRSRRMRFQYFQTRRCCRCSAPLGTPTAFSLYMA